MIRKGRLCSSETFNLSSCHVTCVASRGHVWKLEIPWPLVGWTWSKIHQKSAHRLNSQHLRRASDYSTCFIFPTSTWLTMEVCCTLCGTALPDIPTSLMTYQEKQSVDQSPCVAARGHQIMAQNPAYKSPTQNPWFMDQKFRHSWRFWMVQRPIAMSIFLGKL